MWKITAALSVLIVLALISAIITRSFTHQSFEAETAHLTALQHVKTSGHCPLDSPTIAAEPTWLIEICGSYGISAHQAALRYPNISERVFELYGTVPEFEEIVRQYGPDVVPVVNYFVEHGSAEMLLKETFAEMVDSVAHGNKIKVELAKVTPTQYGLIAIMEIKSSGHAFLGEFTIVKEDARRIEIEHAFDIGKHLLVGGLENLEVVLRRGERLPTTWEIAQAAADGLILIGGAAKAVSLLRGAGKVARGEIAAEEATELGDITRTERVSAQFEDVTALSKSARAIQVLDLVSGGTKIIAAGTVLFVVTHPVWTMHYAAWIAQQTGLPAWFGIGIVTLIIFVSIIVVMPFLLPIIANVLLWLALSATALCVSIGFKFMRFTLAKNVAFVYRRTRGMTSS